MAMSEKKAAKWERKTKRGKAFFIVQTALSFFVLLTGVNLVFEYIFEQRLPEFSWVHIIVRLIVSVLFAFAMWWIGSGQYKDYLLDQKIKKGFRT